MTVAAILAAVQAAQPVAGRHVVVVAHPDDEVISTAGALCCLTDALIVQLTEDTPEREAERAAAQRAAGWHMPILFGGARFRQAHTRLDRLQELVALTQDAAVVWTHPYEGGHLDHDTAAWLVQTAAADGSVRRMEFASYHATSEGQTFGDFWPDPACPAVAVDLSGDRWARKQAALAAYASQAHILRKFPQPAREVYRAAPVYDFSHSPPPPRARWDVKGYQPSTAAWRRVIASREVAA